MEQEEYDFLKTSIYYRGLYIDKFSGFEKSLDFALTNYFTNDANKQIDMMQIIFERMTFESKRTSLKALFDKKCKNEGFVKTKNKKYPHNKLFDEIRRLNDHRNYFAHYIMLPILKDKFDTDVLHLVSVRDGIEMKIYSKFDINKMIEDLDSCTVEVLRLNKS